MTQKLVAAAPKSRLRSQCSHHWVIESPGGPTSVGRCKYCGELKEFSNYLPYSSWAEEKAANRKRSRPKSPDQGERIAN